MREPELQKNDFQDLIVITISLYYRPPAAHHECTLPLPCELHSMYTSQLRVL